MMDGRGFSSSFSAADHWLTYHHNCSYAPRCYSFYIIEGDELMYML
jgi:hypothetical protein